MEINMEHGEDDLCEEIGRYERTYPSSPQPTVSVGVLGESCK